MIDIYRTSYLNTVIEQIRCKAARPFIEELRGHIEDQVADNVAAGMDQEEAVKCAVADMGDPVETGISLDRIHRPQIAVGSGIVLLMNMVINVLENIGRFPPTSTFFPFVSAGGCSLITCYILIGIVLSVYRYKTIYPKHVSVNYPKIKIELKL